MSEYQFKKLAQQAVGEQERLLDVRVVTDGSVRPGEQAPDAMERKKVQELRLLMESVVAGEADLATLQERINSLVTALQKAVKECQVAGQQDATNKAFFDSNIECYGKAIEGLHHMGAAIEHDDAESLWQGLAAFEVGIQEGDALIRG